MSELAVLVAFSLQKRDSNRCSELGFAEETSARISSAASSCLMEEAIAQLQAQDSQERMAAARKLQVLLDQNQKGLSALDVATLLNGTVDLLKDKDEEVCQGALQVLASAASLAGERLQLDFMTLLPAITERLGDEKPSVRDAGRGLLLALMQIFSPTAVLERVSSHVLQHNYWKVREEFVRILNLSLRLFPEKDLPCLRVLLSLAVELVEEQNIHVREAALLFVEKLYHKKGKALRDELQCMSVRPGQLHEISSRLDKVDAKVCTCGPKARASASSISIRQQAKPNSGYLEKHSQRRHMDAPSSRDPPDPAAPSVQVEVQLEGNSDAVSLTIEDPVEDLSPEKKPACCNNLNQEDECCSLGLISLDETLAQSLSKHSDWSVRVAAFAHVRKLISEGSKGLLEVHQCFESIVRKLQEHLSHPHYKVSQAALSTLVEVVRHCKKFFSAQHMEQMLPLLFSQLVDAREETSELAAAALQTIGNSFDIKVLFPALLRCLDEQRSPKGQVAAIEYAIGALVKLDLNYEIMSPMLRPWLTKLVKLVKSRIPKLKETAVMGFVAVYSHLDTIIVLEFILGLSAENQTVVRRALKQYLPQIEVDLLYHMRYRKHRVPLISLEEEEPPKTVREPYWNAFPTVKSCEKPVPTPHDLDRSGVHEAMVKNVQYNCKTPGNTGAPKLRHYNTGWDLNTDRTRRWLDTYSSTLERKQSQETPRGKLALVQTMTSWNPNKPPTQKHEALLAAGQLFESCDPKSWPQYFDRLFLIVLEAAKDTDQFTKDLSLMIVPDLLRQIVSRLSEASLAAKLPILLPALVDAFGSENEGVRKAVLCSLVEIYVMLGKALLPYLSSLSRTQLQLITTYASRVSQDGAEL